MYNFNVKKVLFLFLFVFLFVGFRQAAYAEKINSYDVVIVAHKDGKMDVTENINYDFEDLERHGIFRDIPLYSRVGDLYRIIKIDNVIVERDGKKEKFEKSKNPKQVSFKIGDGDRTITGEHTYKISYTVENAIGSNFPEHDEIYWNATGNDWTVPIERASISVENDFGLKPNSVACYSRNANLNAQFCNSTPEVWNPVTTTSVMNPGDGLTVVYIYPKGTFPPTTLVRELPKTYGEQITDFIFKHIVFIYFLLNIVLPAGLFIWYQRHKNKKRFGRPVVNFEIPKDNTGERISPALAGTIDNGKLERDDVIATIFDLAIRKYIKLEEEKTKRNLLPDSKEKNIEKLKEDDGKLKTYEKKLFNRLFKSGDVVKISELRKDFYKTYKDMEEEAFSQLVEDKYFVRNPKVQRSMLAILGIGTLILGNIFLSGMLFFLSYKLIGRTELGDEVDYKIDGLKLFLKSMDRNYEWQAEKFYTVEAMIPYAMSLGFINKFMEQLKIIKPDYNPTWYSGYHGSFYTSYGSFYSSVNSNVTTSAPSSSSGSSGGFSGGGGGGGGGGSW
jgi:uncharacterized membrane protein